jgi:hypothetical protein
VWNPSIGDREPIAKLINAEGVGYQQKKYKKPTLKRVLAGA